MKKFMQFLLVALGFVIVGMFVNSNCKKTLPEKEKADLDKNLLINWDNKFQGDDSTKSSVRRAVIYARQNYQLVDRIIIDSSYTNSYYDAVDVINGKKFFTRVSLSEKAPGLIVIRLFPVGFQTYGKEEINLEKVVLDLLADYSLAQIEKNRKHS